MSLAETDVNDTQSIELDPEESNPAWVLTLSDGVDVCIGKVELRHLITEPRLYPLPLTPTFSQHLLEWENMLLPIFDLVSWICDKTDQSIPESHSTDTFRTYAVVGYNDFKSSVSYGALALIKPPILIEVLDSSYVEINDNMMAVRSIISSNITHQQKPLPIIDIGKIFSGQLE